MRTFIILIVLVIGASALCQRGRAGQNATVDVQNLGNGCYTIDIQPLGTVLKICNGSETGVTLTIESVDGCATVSNRDTSARFCNGTVGLKGDIGPIGPQGAQGVAGPPVVITAVAGSQCLNVSGDGFGIVCNASNIVGTPGATGPKGDTGATGPTGAPGATSILPRYTVVDGTNYTLTRAGIQQAIDYTSTTLGFGTVYVTESTTSDCVPLILRSGVTLDFASQTFALPATSASCDLLTSPITAFSAPVSLTGNAAALQSSVVVGSAVSFSVGDMVLLTGAVSGGLAAQQVTEIVSIVGTTINLRATLLYSFLTANGAAISRNPSVLQGARLKNIVFSGNGNTGSTSRLVALVGFNDLHVEHVQYTGTMGTTNGASVIDYSLGKDSIFKDTWANLLTVAQSQSVLRFNTVASSHFTNVRVLLSSAGMELRFCVLNTATALSTHGTSGGGIILTGSTSNSLDDVVVTNDATASGIILRNGTNNNVFSTVILANNHIAGMQFGGTGDIQNQVTGYISRANGIAPILLGSGATSNFMQGMSDVGFNAGQNAVHQVTQINGYASRNIQVGAPQQASFSISNTWVPYLVDDTHLAFAAVGTDGTRRISTTPLVLA